MDFEPLARDFLYLAALFLGAGLGCILNRWRRRASARSRNSAVTAALCCFSGAVAALTAASVVSNWTIFRETALYLPLGLLAAVSAAAFRFPRAVGFPAFLALGVFIVWNAYICHVFPAVGPAGDPRLFVAAETPVPFQAARGGNGRVRIGFAASPNPKGGASFSFQSAGADSVLEFRALGVAYSKAFPLLGGANRGAVAEVLGDGEPLYADPRLGRKLVPGLDSLAGLDEGAPAGWGPFLSIQKASGRLEAAKLFAGSGFALAFEGPSLVFRQSASPRRE